MDVLAQLLQASGVRGSIGTRLEAGGSWGLGLDRFPGAAMHAVTEGSAWLTVPDRQPGRQPQSLRPGDVVLLPPGTRHALGSEPGRAAGPCDRVGAARAREDGDVVRLGSGPVSTRILTIHYVDDPRVRAQLLAGLPDVLHVEAAGMNEQLQDVLRVLGRELATPAMAASVVLDSLVDVLLVQLLRAWATSSRADHQWWLTGLGDPVVGAALMLIHQEPGRPWTTAELARRIAVSRATLSRRFSAAMGTTPAAYLLSWRMDVSAARLRETNDPLQAVATAVGYASPHAFSRAFSRAHDEAPGRYRIRYRDADAPLELVGG